MNNLLKHALIPLHIFSSAGTLNGAVRQHRMPFRLIPVEKWAAVFIFTGNFHAPYAHYLNQRAGRMTDTCLEFS